MYRWAMLAIGVVGVVVGFFTGLQATRLLLLGPVHVSVGAVAALALNAGFGVLAAWALRSRDAAFMPGVGWFVAVLAVLFLPHPGGDIVLPGSGADAIAFLLLGVVGVIVAVVVTARIVPPRALPPSKTDR
ncbi:MAG TPA: hypothetical protein VFN80_02585 [Acidothermaceae bacterium]|nr:hypothetical protein [Acidothermaceae bacterium]